MQRRELNVRHGRLYQPQDSIYPFQGMDTLDPSTMVDSRFSPRCVNVYSDKGIITKRPGLSSLGGTFPDKLLGLFTYQPGEAIVTTIAVTSKHQYRLVEGEWVDCFHKILESGTSGYTWVEEGHVNMSRGGGWLKIETTGDFAGGDLISVILDPVVDYSGANCLSLRVKADAAIATEQVSITIGVAGVEVDLDAIGTDESHQYHDVDLSGQDNAAKITFSTLETGAMALYFRLVGVTCAWSGEEDTWVDSAEGIDENGEYLFLTNNIDSVLWWGSIEGGPESMNVFTPTSLDVVTCRALSVYLGALVLGNIESAAGRSSNVVAYSKPGDFFDFEDVTADLVLLDSVKGGIVRLMPFMESLVVYGKNSIGVARFVRGETNYIFDQIIAGEIRLLSGRAIVDLGAYHCIMMQDNIYLFNGTKELMPVADKIYRNYVDSLEVELAFGAFAFNDFHTKRAFFIVPGTDKQAIFVLDYGDFTLKGMKSWVLYEYEDPITCFGFYTEDETYTWEHKFALNYMWEEVVGKWSDFKVSPGFPIAIVGLADRAVIIDRKVHSDEGTDVLGEWESRDFTVPDLYQSVKGRWIEMEVEMEGINVDFLVSTDSGVSWTSVGSIESEGKIIVRFPIDVVARMMRVKISSEKWFRLYLVRLWVTPGGN